jgi:ankyrin repeat protein
MNRFVLICLGTLALIFSGVFESESAEENAGAGGEKPGDSCARFLQSLKGNDVKAVSRIFDPGIDVNANNGEPLRIAVSTSSELVELLLEHGADPNLKDEQKRSPLFIACTWKTIKRESPAEALAIVEALIKHGADVNAREKHGATPLMQAAFEGFLDIVETLLDNGADVTLKDNLKYSAFTHATKRPRVWEVLSRHAEKETEKALRNHDWWKLNSLMRFFGGGDLWTPNSATALIVASRLGLKPAVEGISLNGPVGPNNMDSFHRTALDYALANHHPEIAAILEKHGGKKSRELIADGYGGFIKKPILQREKTRFLEEACSLIQKISSGEHFYAIDLHFSGRKFPRVQISPVAIHLYWPFKEGVLEKLEKENVSLPEGMFVGKTSGTPPRVLINTNRVDSKVVAGFVADLFPKLYKRGWEPLTLEIYEIIPHKPITVELKKGAATSQKP